jgi:hypothetical protein
MARRQFHRAVLALAGTLAFASCSETPTGPASPPQALPVSPSGALATVAPTIGLSRTAFGLCYPATFFPTSVRGFWCYPSASLSIANTGGGTLNWTSTKSATWIKRSQTTGTAPSSIKISVDGTGLPRGTYRGWIKIWAKGATNNPQKVSVAMFRY